MESSQSTPTSVFYNRLFSRGFFIFEDNEPYFQEKLLQVIWNEQIFNSSMTTDNGEKLRVVHPGIWNLEAGPDFHDAVIVIDGETTRGSVEVHFHPRDWNHHHHNTNPDYHNVILHVVWKNQKNLQEFPPGVPIFTISEHLSKSLQEIITEFDLTTYPYARQVPPGDYASLISQVDNNRLIDLFQCYGAARILKKAQIIAEEIEKSGMEQATYQLLFDVMGYKNNRHSFLELAQQVPVKELSAYPDSVAIAVLFGTAGLLPDPTQIDIHPKHSEWVNEMWSLWWSRRKDYNIITWKRNRMRPYNSPERRILAAYFLLKKNYFTLSQKIIRTMLDNEKPEKCLKELVKLLTLSNSPEYDDFYSFAKVLKNPAALLGTNRIRDLIVNFALPLFFAYCFFKNDPDQCEKGKQVFLCVPRLQDNRLFKESAHHFFIPPSRVKEVIINASAQQGMLQLYKDLA